MHKKHSFREMIKNKGSIQFLVRLLAFLIIFSFEALIIKTLVDFTFKPNIPVELYLPFRMPLVLLMTAMIFYVICRHRINALKKIEEFKYKRFFIFLGVNIVSFFIFLKVNIFMNQKPYYVIQNKLIFTPLWYLTAILLGGSLFVAFFKFDYIIKFFKNFNKELIISFIISLIFRYTYIYLSRAWGVFSTLVAHVVAFMLKLTYSNTHLSISNGTPIISSQGFGARIYAPCSGVEGMSLFMTLFLIMIIIEWGYIDKLKSLLLLVAGTAGAFVMNIMRVYLIYILGINVSEEFAIGFFHSNIGWILFSAYFIIFELMCYEWMRKKKMLICLCLVKKNLYVLNMMFIIML